MVDLKELKRTPSFGGVRKPEVSMVTVVDAPDAVAALNNNGVSEDKKPIKETLKENIKPHSMDISPWLVSSDVVTGSTKTKEATIIRKSVITTQL